MPKADQLRLTVICSSVCKLMGPTVLPSRQHLLGLVKDSRTTDFVILSPESMR
jgi:hypothetical protein